MLTLIKLSEPGGRELRSRGVCVRMINRIATSFGSNPDSPVERFLILARAIPQSSHRPNPASKRAQFQLL